MNRRDFIFLGRRDPGILDLSCERLYMRFVDANMTGTRDNFLSRLEADFCQVRRIRLHEASWLSEGDLKAELEPLFQEFRARGGRIEYL